MKKQEKTVEIISSNNGSGLAIKTDVTNVEDIKDMVNKVSKCNLVALDIMVNNAGVTRTSSIMDLNEKDWDWIHNVNAKGTFFCLQMQQIK